jgi:hypothetical protein
MVTAYNRYVSWKWQGLLSQCWLTCIEMLMQHKHGSKFGEHGKHSDLAREHFLLNKGSSIYHHASYYGLSTNSDLDAPGADAQTWLTALRRVPVIAEVKYGAIGPHVILVTGIDKSGELIYLNPNMAGALPRLFRYPTTVSIRKIYDRRVDTFGHGGPFWQVSSDIG